MLRPAAVACLVLSAACGASPDADPSGAVTVRDSAGVEIIENHRPILADAAWQLTPEPVLSLPDSVATGGSPYVQEAKRLSNGDILVLTGNGVRWLDREGRPLRMIATEGEGPGEFRHAGELLVLPGDTVLVDGDLKTARWDRDGNFLGETRLDVKRFNALGPWSECSRQLLSDGSRIGCRPDPTIPASETNRPSRDIGGGWTDPGPGLLRQLRRIAVAPPSLDTTYPLGVNIGIEQYGVNAGEQTEFVIHPLHARTQIASGGTPLRIAIATNPEWRVELWSTTGTLERVILLDHGRSVTTPREKAAGDSMMRARELRGARDTIATENALAQVPTPDSLPGVRYLALDGQGYLAVVRGGLFAAGFPVSIDFFDPTGRWVATKQMPARWRLLDFGEDYLLGVRYDEDDLPHLEMYGLKRQVSVQGDR